MSEALPLTRSYNLARLGNAGDEVRFTADAQECARIAQWCGVQSLEKFQAQVEIRKLAPNRFGLGFHLTADVTQRCVVTLEPVPSHMERDFSRELVFVGAQRHKPVVAESETVLDTGEEEGPEEIESLHIDLAAPLLEEFALSLDPYPRAPGVEFRAQSPDSDRPESPFAVLKGLK
ncbi:MAG TPA: DUF177 domain-containing protein [Rhizomicrobium sp.]|nr:DUF177 domain-containing protein [Rhizomicrobium sp.]